MFSGDKKSSNSNKSESEEEESESETSSEDLEPVKKENQIPYKPINKFDFEWDAFSRPWTPPDMRREPFSSTDVGSNSRFDDAYQSFVAIWNREIMDYIAQETNRHAKKMRGSEFAGLNSRWQDTSADELYVYFATLIAMGFSANEKPRLEDFWTEDRSLFSTTEFSCAMSLRRFSSLSSYLHFVNNDDVSNEELPPSQKKWLQIKPIIDHLNEKFSQLLNLDRNLVIFETFAESESFLEKFIRKENIKVYEICDFESTFVWRIGFEAESEQNETSDESPLANNVSSSILRLIRGLEGKGYTLWLDKNYNSPPLARELKSMGLDCVGTFKTDTQCVPLSLTSVSTSNMAAGQMKACTARDIDLYAVRGEECMHFISTFHGPYSYKFDGVVKPTVVVDHQTCMCVVTSQTESVAMNPIEDKGSKLWYHVLFKRLLNISVINALLLIKDELEMPPIDFRRNLVGQLLEHHSHVLPSPPTPESEFSTLYEDDSTISD